MGNIVEFSCITDSYFGDLSYHRVEGNQRAVANANDVHLNARFNMHVHGGPIPQSLVCVCVCVHA